MSTSLRCSTITAVGSTEPNHFRYPRNRRDCPCLPFPKWSLSQNHRFVIAFRSPDGVAESGLLMRPPEKNGHKAWLWRAAGHFLRSGLEVKVAKLRPFPAIFGEILPDFSAVQTGWRSTQSRANPSPQNSLANSEKYREFLDSGGLNYHTLPHIALILLGLLVPGH